MSPLINDCCDNLVKNMGQIQEKDSEVDVTKYDQGMQEMFPPFGWLPQSLISKQSQFGSDIEMIPIHYLFKQFCNCTFRNTNGTNCYVIFVYPTKT